MLKYNIVRDICLCIYRVGLRVAGKLFSRWSTPDLVKCWRFCIVVFDVVFMMVFHLVILRLFQNSDGLFPLK